MTTKKPHLSSLHIHEWIAILAFSGFLGMVALCTYISSPSMTVLTDEPHYLADESIEVFVLGEVQQPGARLVRRGTTVKEVLHQAEPKEDADLARFRMDSKLRANQVLKVLPKKAAKRAASKRS